MVTELKVTRKRGGNHHPLSVRAFILEHLAIVGEDYGANIHRAYKDVLDKLASASREDKRRGRKHYHKPTFNSFNKYMNLLAREGFIVFTGREEESDKLMFRDKVWKPVRRYYKIKAGE